VKYTNLSLSADICCFISDTQHIAEVNEVNVCAWLRRCGWESAFSLRCENGLAPCADTVLNMRILSVSVKNYPYPISSDVGNCYPYHYPIRIRSIDRESKKITPDIFGTSCNTGCPILIPPGNFWHRCRTVDVAYFLMFATVVQTSAATPKVVYLRHKSPN